MSRPIVSVVLIAVAIVFFVFGRYSGVHQPPVGPRDPIAVGASLDLKCGDTNYTVSTGNKGGECASGGNGNNAMCDDGKGNTAEVNCSSGCKSSKGSGSCTIKS
jgi:hypothetical protein